MKHWTHELYAKIEKDRLTMTLNEVISANNLGITLPALSARLKQYKKTGKCYVDRTPRIITTEQMLQFVRDGVTMRDLRVIHGYTYNEIQLSVKATGIEPPKTQWSKKKHDFSVVPELVEQGKTPREIALIVGCGLTAAQAHYNAAIKQKSSDSLIADAPEEIKRLICGNWKRSQNIYQFPTNGSVLIGK